MVRMRDALNREAGVYETLRVALLRKHAEIKPDGQSVFKSDEDARAFARTHADLLDEQAHVGYQALPTDVLDKVERIMPLSAALVGALEPLFETADFERWLDAQADAQTALPNNGASEEPLPAPAYSAPRIQLLNSVDEAPSS